MRLSWTFNLQTEVEIKQFDYLKWMETDLTSGDVMKCISSTYLLF